MPVGVYVRTPETRAILSAAKKGKPVFALRGRKRGLAFRQRMKVASLGNTSHKGKPHSDATKKRISLANKGKRPWNYKTDRNQVKTNEKKHLDSRYKEWMLAVKGRDKWKCRTPDGSCSGRLEAHHILDWIHYPQLRYQINNGITLCHKHHPRKRMDEELLAPAFTGIIKSSGKA